MRRALVVVMLCGLASNAWAAASSVSVLGVSGPGGPHFADQLEQDLAELYEVLPGELYRTAAERMGRRGASPDEVREVSMAVRIDAIVAGSVQGEGKERVLLVAVREGASGRVVARGRYELAGRTLPLLREQVLRDLVRALEHVRHIPKRGQPIAEAAPQPEPETEFTPEEVTLPVARVTTRAPQQRSHRGFYAGVGPALMSRSLAFDVATAPGYRGGAIVAIRADGAVFPLALSAELADAHPVLASFGITGSYERAFGLESKTALGATSGDASRWGVALVGRAPAGRGGAVTIETGYQQIRWVSSSPTQLGVPDVGYGLFDLGVAFEHTLGTPVALITARVAALGVVDPGAISEDAQYGPTRGGGLELDLGLTLRPTAWLWVRGGARYTPLFLRFAAAGARLAHSATDQFVDGMVEVGFAL